MASLTDDDLEILFRAYKDAKGDRKVKEAFGVGVLGWLLAGIELFKLIARLIELFKESRNFASPRLGYSSLASKFPAKGVDNRLLSHLYHAELGGVFR